MIRLVVIVLLLLIVVLVSVILINKKRYELNDDHAIRRVASKELKSLQEDMSRLAVLVLDKQDSLPTEVWDRYLILSKNVDDLTNDDSVSKMVRLRKEYKDILIIVKNIND